ncbi:MAG: TPM domain-containing protein [bacterium]|nr:TPM domain-containing protein [bacterium]
MTVNTVSPLDINTYAVELYEDWGIGKKDKDNGVLVLLAMDERKVRIESGYGVEGILPDGLCGEIIRYKMVPYFKKGDFGSGVAAGVITIASKIAEEYGVDLSLDETPRTHYEDRVRPIGGIGGILGGLFTLLLFFLIFGLRLGLFGSLFLPMGGYWRSGGYSGGLGGFSGGFSGFGGGLSGGGGATGDW